VKNIAFCKVLKWQIVVLSVKCSVPSLRWLFINPGKKEYPEYVTDYLISKRKIKLSAGQSIGGLNKKQEGIILLFF